MSDIRKYITLLENAGSMSLTQSILSEWDDEYDSLDDLLDNEDLDDVLENLLDNDMLKEVEYLLNDQNIGSERFNSHGDDHGYIISLSNNMGIVRSGDGNTYYVYSDPERIIYDWDDNSILSFFDHDYKEKSDEFWDSVMETSYAYHATSESNIEGIKSHGIESRIDSRGMTNRGTGEAVFTTLNRDELELGTYGDVYIQINLYAMKIDGYMPMVSQEEPLIIDEYRSSIAHMFNLEYEFESGDGLSPDTLIMFGDIPQKYITIMN